MSAQPIDEPAPCRRRAMTTWTRCTCAGCRIDQLRADKLRRHGRLPTRAQIQTLRDAGQAKIRALLDDGWSPTAIADAWDVPTPVMVKIGEMWSRGQLTRPGQALARKLLVTQVREPRAGLVPAWPSTRRLQALACMGWTTDMLAARGGLTRSVVADAQAGRRRQITAVTAHAVRALYVELQDRRGPSERAVSRAVSRKWGPPAAWNDIDDPNERPKGLGGSPHVNTTRRR